MKRTLLFTLFLMCLTQGLHSQSSWSLQAGLTQSYLDFQIPTISNVNNQHYSEPYTGLGLILGLEYLNKELYSMSSSLLFFQSGGSSNEEDKINSRYYGLPDELKTGYLSVSTQLNLNPIRKKYRLQLGIGPRVDFMVVGNKQHPFNLYEEDNHPGQGIARLNIGVNYVFALYRDAGKWEYGISTTYLQRNRKLLDFESGRFSGQVFRGAYAKEQTLLFALKISRKIGVSQPEKE